MDISTLLLYAKQYVPYYSSLLMPDIPDIHSFPIINKNKYITNSSSFLSVLADKSKMKEIKTSGSTGTPMSVYKSNKDYMLQLRCLWQKRYMFHGISPNDRCINFIMSEYQPSQGINSPSIDNKTMSLSINAIEENIERWIPDIQLFQPSYIIGYPSVISIFADALAKAKSSFPDSVLHIECMGEFLFPSQQRLIEDIFGKKIINYYGCTEVFGIAYSCEMGKLHILGNNVYVEVIPSGEKVSHYGREGNIVITGLNSVEAPFIRYDLEDVGVIYKGSECSCGCQDDFIEITMSRMFQNIQISPDRHVHSSIFYGFIEAINASLDQSIYWFKFLQEDFHIYTLYIQLKTGYEIFLAEIEKRITLLMRRHLGESLIVKVIHKTHRRESSNNKKHEFIESTMRSACLG